MWKPRGRTTLTSTSSGKQSPAAEGKDALEGLTNTEDPAQSARCVEFILGSRQGVHCAGVSRNDAGSA